MSSDKDKNASKEARPEETNRPVDPIAATGAVTQMLSEDENSGGSIRISENVVAAIVHKYVLDVDGIVRFASGSLVGNIGEFFGRPDPEKNLQVDLEDERVNISVTLVLEFGVHIPTVAMEVQDVVAKKVEELTGKQVTRVDVTIQDLEEPGKVEPEPAAEDAEPEADA